VVGVDAVVIILAEANNSTTCKIATITIKDTADRQLLDVTMEMVMAASVVAMEGFLVMVVELVTFVDLLGIKLGNALRGKHHCFSPRGCFEIQCLCRRLVITSDVIAHLQGCCSNTSS
jgi:hypothetical protein